MKDRRSIAEELGKIKRSVLKTIPAGLIKYALSGTMLEETDEDIIKDVELLIENQVLAGAGIEYPALKAPSIKQSEGDYLLGYVMINGRPSHAFYLRDEDLLRHLGIFGSTGSGKSNACMNLLIQLSKKRIPWMVLDWKKSYRDLLSLSEFKHDDILILTIGEPNPLKFNPLIPPKGTSPSIWLKKLIEIICTAYYLGEGVAYLLMRSIDMAYQKFGVYNGSSTYPTFKDVLQLLEELDLKGRSAQWKASALRALANLTYGELGYTLCSQSNRSLPNYLQRNVIIELHNLTNSDKKFLLSALLLWIYFYRLNEGRREELKHFLVIEEAHHIATRKFAETSGDENIVEMLIRMIRELGQGIALIDQTPSLLSKPILGNTFCTICMNLKERSDINLMARILQIDSNEKRFLSKLEVGEAIVKLQGRFTDPFAIKIPLVKIKKGSVTDEDIRKYYGKISIDKGRSNFSSKIREYHGVDKCSSEKAGGVPETQKRLQNLKIMDEQIEISSLPRKEEISENALKLLIDIASKPLSATTERYQRLGMNRYQGNKARRELEEFRLIKPVNLPGRKGGYIRGYELTGNGEAFLKNLGINARSMRKGGLLHQYIIKMLSEEFEAKGLNVEIEKPIGGGRATDIVVNGRIAVEVEVTKRDLISDLNKNLDAGFETVVFICNNSIKFEDLADREKVRIFRINEIDRAVKFILSLLRSDNSASSGSPRSLSPSATIPEN